MLVFHRRHQVVRCGRRFVRCVESQIDKRRFPFRTGQNLSRAFPENVGRPLAISVEFFAIVKKVENFFAVRFSRVRLVVYSAIQMTIKFVETAAIRVIRRVAMAEMPLADQMRRVTYALQIFGKQFLTKVKSGRCLTGEWRRTETITKCVLSSQEGGAGRAAAMRTIQWDVTEIIFKYFSIICGNYFPYYDN